MTGPSPKESTHDYHYSIESLMEGRRMAEKYGALRTRPLTYAEQQAMTAGRPDGFKAFFIHTNEGEKEMAQDTQAAPIPNDGPSMHDLAVEVIKERREIGLKEYGTILQANNGRDFLTDSIEEVADLLCYLVGAREEAKQEKPLSVADKMKACEEEYQEYADMLSKLEMARLANEGHQRTIEVQGTAIAGYRRRNEVLTNSRNSFMERAEELQESLANCEAELGDAREANVELRVELARHRNGVQAIAATVDEMKVLLNLARGANGRFHQRYLDHQRMITELQRKVGSFDQVEAAYQNRLEQLTKVRNRDSKAAYLRLDHIRKLEKTIVDAMDKSAPYALKAYNPASELDQ